MERCGKTCGATLGSGFGAAARRRPAGVALPRAALAGRTQVVEPLSNVSGLQRLELAPSDSRNDVEANVAFVGRIRRPSDAWLRDVLEPVGHVVSDGKGCGRGESPILSPPGSGARLLVFGFS
jgi:hypothetical protein